MKQNSVNLEQGDARRSGAGRASEAAVSAAGMAGHADAAGKADAEARKKESARAYQAAMEAVFAIPISGGLGYLADAKWETGPLGLFIGLAFGFAAFVLRLWKMRSLVAASDVPTAPGPVAPDDTGRNNETHTGAQGSAGGKQDAR